MTKITTKKSAFADLVRLTNLRMTGLITLHPGYYDNIFLSSVSRVWTRRELSPVDLGYQASLANLPSPHNNHYNIKPLHIAIIILSVVSLAAIASAGYRYRNSRQSPPASVLPASTDNKNVVEKIGTLIQLPADENPTIATITDKTKLADQAFFAPAQNGDIVLIYTAAKKAYLYRPSTNKVIDVAIVNSPAP